MEHIIGTAFMPEDKLSAAQRRDLDDGMAAAAAFWQAAQTDKSWQQKHLRPHGRCIYSALSVLDILHALGRTDARPFKTGLELHMVSNAPFVPARVLTIGYPGTPFVKGAWNAHLVVRLGDILIDPAIAQMKRDWNDMPHYAAFLAGAPEGHSIELNGFGTAPTTTVHRRFGSGNSFQISYFELPRQVEVATRGWRSAGDARLEARVDVVRRAVAIRHAQIGAASQRRAA